MTYPHDDDPTSAIINTNTCREGGPAARTAAQQISGCRWIDGDVRRLDWRYCQRPRLPGRSYCAEHYARSINPDGDRQFTAEQAECDHYLDDLPPPNGEFDDELDDQLDDPVADDLGGA